MIDYTSSHTGVQIDAAVSVVLAGRAGLQGVYVNGSEIAPDANNKVSLNVPIVSQTTGTSTTDIMSQNAVTTQLNSKADSGSLSTVATSGSYSDLTNKPTKLSDFTNDGIFITNSANDLVNYYSKTQTDSLLSNKVDKVTGKGLSTEDFTSAEKTKLSNIETEANKTVVVQSIGNSTTSVMSQDAVTTQLNSKATVSYYTATLSSSNWTNSAPYTQTINVSGILATDKPIVDLSSPSLNNLDSWSYVSSAQSGDGTLTFSCFENKPTEDLSINIMVVR